MTELGKLLVGLGGVIVVAGIVLMVLGRTNLPLGRLPGDFLYRGKNTTVYFPLATSVVLRRDPGLTPWAAFFRRFAAFF
jgi:hypothetical protein